MTSSTHDLVGAVVVQLQHGGSKAAREILRGVKSTGFAELISSDVNRVLYARKQLFVRDSSVTPRWTLMNSSAAAHVPAPRTATRGTPARSPLRPQPVGPAITIELRPWQREALAEWVSAGRCGVVEAVTGTGKTRVGVAAIADVLARGGRATVLVPGIDLLEQWVAVLRNGLPGVHIDGRGGGKRGTESTCDVLVTTVQSAVRCASPSDGRLRLLVADEVHRYGSPMFAAALTRAFSERLGLTATYERSDDGVESLLEPYFGRFFNSCGYDRAYRDKILAPVRAMLVGVAFADQEQETFEMWDEMAKKARVAAHQPARLRRGTIRLLHGRRAAAAQGAKGPALHRCCRQVPPRIFPTPTASRRMQHQARRAVVTGASALWRQQGARLQRDHVVG